jgi:hypothetical protein
MVSDGVLEFGVDMWDFDTLCMQLIAWIIETRDTPRS